MVSNTSALLTRSGTSSSPSTPGKSPPAPAHDAATISKLVWVPGVGNVLNLPVRLVSTMPLSAICHQYWVSGASPPAASFTTLSASTVTGGNSTGSVIEGLSATSSDACGPFSTSAEMTAPESVGAPTHAHTTPIGQPQWTVTITTPSAPLPPDRLVVPP